MALVSRVAVKKYEVKSGAYAMLRLAAVLTSVTCPLRQDLNNNGVDSISDIDSESESSEGDNEYDDNDDEDYSDIESD